MNAEKEKLKRQLAKVSTEEYMCMSLQVRSSTIHFKVAGN
jgi:hypothetical protein